MKGAAIDDLTFKNYKVSLESDEKVTLLGPRNIEDGYLIESGFVTSDKNIDIPNSDSVWSIIGNNKLTNQSPVKLSWSNKQGITFEKEISLDDKYFGLTVWSPPDKVISPFDFGLIGVIEIEKPGFEFKLLFSNKLISFYLIIVIFISF